MKELPIKDFVKKFVKIFFKSNDILFKFHLRMEFHLKKLKQQFMKVTKLKPNLCTTYIELCKNFERRDRETDRNGNFH